MRDEVKAGAFRGTVEEVFAHFVALEETLRAQYLKVGEDHGTVEAATMLERATRRFLIDPVLKALGWDPDTPEQIIEEARGRSAAGDRLYFDYLGKTREQLPVLLGEAKHCDCEWVRHPHGEPVSAREAARLVSNEIDAQRRGQDGKLISFWSEWLAALRAYVVALDEEGRASLRRVVLTAGSWMIVFEDPIGAFLGDAGDAAPDEAAIHCFASRDEIIAGAQSLYRLLDRERLVDTLPLVLSDADALKFIRGDSVERYWRGALVATTPSGSSVQQYPTRSVYPALVIESGGRIFGVARFGTALEEPTDQERLSEFANALTERGEEFERDLLRGFGRSDLSPRSLAELPAYRPELGLRSRPVEGVPLEGSTAARAETYAGRGFVRSVGSAAHEFLAITGEAWFYKLGPEPNCTFHSFTAARARGVAGPVGRFGPTLISFTETDQPRHCEHQTFREGMRHRRCEVTPVETHLCCRACAYEPYCWSADGDQRPCPQ